MAYKFDSQRTKEEVVNWIRDWFENNGRTCNAVVGISGGKDSTIVAALCVEALGRDRVIGVMMPNIAQADIEDSFAVVEHLGIQHYMIPVTMPVTDILNQLMSCGISPSPQTTVNLPARIRMATLYAVSQSVNGRVANTCNLSEDWIGYSTRYGDLAGDFCPLAGLTVEEVKQIGLLLDLPEHLINKAPSDGLCGRTDEDNFGFTYAELDKYIRTGVCDNQTIKIKIDQKHRANLFKLSMPPSYEPGLAIQDGYTNHLAALPTTTSSDSTNAGTTYIRRRGYYVSGTDMLD